MTQGEGAARRPPYVLQTDSPHVKRFSQQRWLLDNVIRANGIDWDQPRSIYLAAPCGAEASADFAAIRMRVQKLADATPAFEAVARRREARATSFAQNGALVSARDNYFMASIHYGAAMWPIDQSNAQNIALNDRKFECYRNYAQLAGELADHRIEEVNIRAGGITLPAWFHLPYGYSGGKVPAVLVIPGMDSFKETSIALNGDRWLSRGIAVLAIDGPGQYESPLMGAYFSMENWIATARASADWLCSRAEVDASRIGVSGTSFGTFFATICAANEPRYRACAINAPCLEPGCHTIFEEASPTFKQRFMFMSNYVDEADFDEFRQTISWVGHAERIRAPFLCLAGEADELSPLSNVEAMFAAMDCPKQLVIYQDCRHAIGTVPAANLGPFAPALVADWMADQFAGKPAVSERWFVEASGNVRKSAL
ncbi:MAG: alpha/beta hydrolase [Alphaproteobacteria bacterium]|nr:alpha/beta hydrolase [Alphaproteobacteria bacterium]